MKLQNLKSIIHKSALFLAMFSMLSAFAMQAPGAFAETSDPEPIPPPFFPPPIPVAGGLVTQDPAAITQRYIADQRAYYAELREYMYRQKAKIQQTFEFKIKLAIVSSVLDVIAYGAQQVAYGTAKLILTGGDSQEPLFWNQPFGDWLTNLANNALNHTLTNLDTVIGDYTQKNLGTRISLCSKPDPLSIKLSLSVPTIQMLGLEGTCTLSNMTKNFEAISDMVSSGDALNMERAQFNENANDLDASLTVNNYVLQKQINIAKKATLERAESNGMKPIADVISGKIKFPSVLANESLKNMDPIKLHQVEADKRSDYMIQAYWQTGLEGIPMLAFSTFVNTMLIGLLEKAFAHTSAGGDSVNASAEQVKITFESLTNEDASGQAQDLYERQSFAKALGDFIIPNYSSTADKDIIKELSTCTDVRSRWNCAMDQGLAVAIYSATKDGALTVGRALGIGTEAASFSPNAQGLHADWEMIPESDITNNTDPSCYQRAYCAGNLKKLRMARIIPIGWEMAANSPYNYKKSGKYITLGDVARGFYNCNDQGQLDKDHPWCHLIDPNWILAAPKYQCRASGYGDALMPNIGTRLEECGDLTTCLGSNQKGECVNGYGYCLAERPVYRFDARECQEQYASCRTYQYSGGTLSALRYTTESGNCSAENMGCMWYATQRYVTSTKSPDDLWVGTINSGPRVYFDKNLQPCTQEGCTKVYNVELGASALNLVQNGSFEDKIQETLNDITQTTGLTGWFIKLPTQLTSMLNTDASDKSTSVQISGLNNWLTQKIPVAGNRNYTLSLSVKASSQHSSNAATLSFYSHLNPDGTVDLNSRINAQSLVAIEDCAWEAGHGHISFTTKATDTWTRQTCKFVSPVNAVASILILGGTTDGIMYDAVQLEEGEYATAYTDGVATGLDESYLKIAPDEYKCTGVDSEDNPACQRFARICKQTEVGCNGYKDVEDPSAPEIPASLSAKDLCPAVCAGYGQYQKLSSAFDLVKNPAQPEFNDPDDKTIEYFIPSLASSCTLADVGCEAFTSMESATGTGEQVAYYSKLRSCAKPGDMTATYFTWEGSDVSGYQLRTWALIASSTDETPEDNPPKLILKGASFGTIKDPATCNDITWKSGMDPDCRQFYDSHGNVYYRFYSQTVSSDPACTLYRLNDSSVTDCTKTGGQFQPADKTCMYYALPSQSTVCSATAGGCRAYLGSTGRNNANVFSEDFKSKDSPDWISTSNIQNNPTQLQLSLESVLVGDQSLKMFSSGPIDAVMSIPLPTTSTLYRISFWAKSLHPQTTNPLSATVSLDGDVVGTFYPDIKWQRFEFGPLTAKGLADIATGKVKKVCKNFTYTPQADYQHKIESENPGATPELISALVKAGLSSNFVNPNKECTANSDCGPINISENANTLGTAQGICGFAGITASVGIHAADGIDTLFIDTIRIDQLNDTRFVRKNTWNVPAVCDASYPEGVPEQHAMVGCRQYKDRDGNTAYVRQFNSLCSEKAIGCKAFVDTRGMPNPYPETKTINGTPAPSKHADGIAIAYDNQFLGSWSITSPAYRYIYLIDDDRGRCDSSENMCRAFGKPIFDQDRLTLTSTAYAVDPADVDLHHIQTQLYKFETKLYKNDWNSYFDQNGEPALVCRKDELFCDRFQSGNVIEYFRDPGDHTCEWKTGKKLSADPVRGIFSDGEYGGWFRTGQDIPCYPGSITTPPYQKNGDTFGVYFNGEDKYAGWVGKCPADQSECTEFVDPNDTSDSAHPQGRSYFIINSDKVDTRSCAGAADPLTGCILFQNKSITQLQANAKATYDKVIAERGAPQSPIDCKTDSDNPYCKNAARCRDFKDIPEGYGVDHPDNYKKFVSIRYLELQDKVKNLICQTDADCEFPFYNDDHQHLGTFKGTCIAAQNDSNIVLKVKLDRECARWMGCRTGETVFDAGQQKFVNQCSELQLCEKNSSKNDDIYCSKFTDRTKEDFLTLGQFVSMNAYSSRQIGFGKMDYSGFTIPNQYLVADIKARNVGSDLFKTGNLFDQYRLDQRLVAEIPYSSNVIQTTDPAFTAIHTICQDARTKRYGYNADGKCILPIGEAQNLSLVAGGQTSDDLSRNIQELYKEFAQGNVSTRNVTLQSAMPSPECQLYPEESSPLPNEYVTEWNNKANPPVPVKMAEGYENAKACVFGEDCSCSYRKVRYQSGDERFYSLTGNEPAVGVCKGGDRNGQSCVPDGYMPVDAQNKLLLSSNTLSVNVNASCPQGLCTPIQDVVFENGRYGYCLERDITRASNISQTSAPCLTWSPQIVIGGKNDTTHYSPTAGYMPPQGMGEYYCSSGANEQRLVTPDVKTNQFDVNVGSWTGSEFWSPGKMMQFAFSRSDVWSYADSSDEYKNLAIDGATNKFTTGQYLDCIKQDANASNNDKNALICNDKDGILMVKAKDMQNMRFACRRASVCEGLDVANPWARPEQNNKEGRWIMTGDAITNSYMEYFIPDGWGITAYRENYYDYHYGMFRFSIQPYALGTACKWNPRWEGMNHLTVDTSKQADFSCSSYLQQLQSSSQQFYAQFNQDFKGILDRNSEQVLTDSQGIPIKLKCAVGNGSCFYKFWETGYKDSGKLKFQWPESTHKDRLDQFNFRDQYKIYYGRECQSGQPYFSIRAVFQNINAYTNTLTADQAKTAQLEGPWQFIGFWFTTCMPTNGMPHDPAWMYMRLDIVTADVCREVSQVISPNTRESAAFADRAWSQGKFLMPSLGLKYDSRNEPFGSALAANKIGTSPMLIGASVPLSDDLQKSPTFVDSGLTVASLFNQQNSWVPLSNLFARVYRVWRWDPQPVFWWDWACVSGSQRGKLCTPNATKVQGLKECGDYATCDPNVDVSIKNQNWRCNALSGVNRGLHCGDNDIPARNVDPICHNAAMTYTIDPTKPEPDIKPLLLSSCKKSIGEEKDYLTIPLADFGHCWTSIYGAGLQNTDCDTGLAHVLNGAPDDAVMKFQIIKCKNKDKVFAYPIVGNYQHEEASGLTIYHTDYDLWYDVYDMMLKALEAGGVRTVDLEKGTADCGELTVANVQSIAGHPSSILEALKNLPKYSFTPTSDPNNYATRKKLDELYNKNNMPNYFELGFWDADQGEHWIVKRCSASAVNAGMYCANEGTNSAECPTEVAACGSPEYTELKHRIWEEEYKAHCPDQGPCTYQLPADFKYPPCGYCTINDSAEIQKVEDRYKDFYPGTGFCKGFNPLSRCKTNDDCTFTNFEFWGSKDLGQANGLRFPPAGARAKIISYDDDPQVSFSPKPPTEDLALPIPLFAGEKQGFVPKKYSEPAMLRKPETDAQGCKDEYWKAICYAFGNMIYAMPVNLQSLEMHNLLIDTQNKCFDMCFGAFQLFPNSYAKNFDEIVQDTQNKKLRTAAIAPFAIDPQIRNQLSRGFFAYFSHVGLYMYAYFWMGVGFANQLDTSLLKSDLSSFIAQIPKEKSIAYFIKHRGHGLADIFAPRTNGSFLWNPEKLYFTTVFKQLLNDYGGPRSKEDVQPATDSQYQFDKYWEGYGMSSKLYELLVKIMQLKNNWNFDPLKDLTFKLQYDKDMDENFFSKTGWGTFMHPLDAKLQLYPGAIPAAIPREGSGADMGYTVYLPGHCEPPLGGTDNDTVIGESKNILLATQNQHVGLGWPTAPQSGDMRRPFIMPWDGFVNFHTLTYFNDEAGEFGIKEPDKYPWTQPYVTQKSNIEPSNEPITCTNCYPVESLRTTCRCVGGRLNGTIQESQQDCNADLPEVLNPDKHADPNDPAIPVMCKAVSNPDRTPIPECLSSTGSPNNDDPDQDNNSCTHRGGYVPRGDVCADGRDNCLISYNVSDPVSTNHINRPSNQVPAPSATDVTNGLDTYSYITGGKTNKDGRNYISWYHPRPPRIAAPDTSKASQSANAQPIVYMDTFSLDGRPEGLVYYGGGQGKATIRFYAWADHNQGPIKDVVIDWGDGTIQNIDNAQLKNQKPLCNITRECEFVPGLTCSSDADCPPGGGACRERGTCNKQSYKDCYKNEDCGTDDTCVPRVMFGNSTDACRQGFMEFSHVYKCDIQSAPTIKCGSINAPDPACENEPDLACGSCRPGEACVSGLAPHNGCYNTILNRCRYTPRVMVKDNWGWCTGDCSQDGEASPNGQLTKEKFLMTRHPNGGCWDGSQTKLNTEITASSNTLYNECSTKAFNSYLPTDPLLPIFKQYRPWIIYRGAVEVEAPNDYLYTPQTGLVNIGQLGIQVQGVGFSSVQQAGGNMPNFQQQGGIQVQGVGFSSVQQAGGNMPNFQQQGGGPNINYQVCAPGSNIEYSSANDRQAAGCVGNRLFCGQMYSTRKCNSSGTGYVECWCPGQPY